MEQLIYDFSVGLFFWQSLLFLILIGILYKFAWKPILSALDEREGSIKEALNSAEQARNEVQNLKSENENILKEAKEERARIINEANTIKERIVSEAKDKAKGEAEKLVADAKEAIEIQHAKGRLTLRERIDLLLDKNSFEEVGKISGGIEHN